MPSAAAEMPDMGMEEGDYPDGDNQPILLLCGHSSYSGSSEVDEEIEDLLCLDLTHEEIKAAFRCTHDTRHIDTTTLITYMFPGSLMILERDS